MCRLTALSFTKPSANACRSSELLDGGGFSPGGYSPWKSALQLLPEPLLK